MSYELIVAPLVDKHIKQHLKAGNKQLVAKILDLLKEISIHPQSGTGQIEHLKHYKGEDIWSRRIDSKHRLIYQIIEDKLIVIAISAYGHYGDK